MSNVLITLIICITVLLVVIIIALFRGNPNVIQSYLNYKQNERREEEFMSGFRSTEQLDNFVTYITETENPLYGTEDKISYNRYPVLDSGLSDLP